MEYRIFELRKDKLIGRSYSIHEGGVQKYQADISWFRKKATLVNLVDGKEIEIIRLFTFLKMQFEFHRNGLNYGHGTKALSIFSSAVEVTTAEGDFHIKGTIASKEFTISKKGTEIAKISRQTGFFQPVRYGIAVLATENVDLTLAFALMIELILKVKKKRRG